MALRHGPPTQSNYAVHFSMHNVVPRCLYNDRVITNNHKTKQTQSMQTHVHVYKLDQMLNVVTTCDVYMPYSRKNSGA